MSLKGGLDIITNVRIWHTSCSANMTSTDTTFPTLNKLSEGISLDSLSYDAVYPIVRKKKKLHATSQYRYSKSAG